MLVHALQTQAQAHAPPQLFWPAVAPSREVDQPSTEATGSPSLPTPISLTEHGRNNPLPRNRDDGPGLSKRKRTEDIASEDELDNELDKAYVEKEEEIIEELNLDQFDLLVRYFVYDEKKPFRSGCAEKVNCVRFTKQLPCF